MAKNQWMNQDEDIIVSETNPNQGLDFPMYAPVVNLRRVNRKRATYHPYAGNSEWAKAANQRLADEARTAFERR